VFLKIMAFARDIGDDFLTIGQAHPSDLPECGIWLLRGLGLDLEANASALWTLMQGRGLASFGLECASCLNELVVCRHGCLSPKKIEILGMNIPFLTNLTQRIL
jgi:hypothetical protein